MKKHLFLSAALFGGLALGATSCDKGGGDDKNKIEPRLFSGTATMSVMGGPVTIDNDSVEIRPMAADSSMATIRFAEQSGTVTTMNLNFSIGGFTIDSVLVDYTSEGYTMRRTNRFTTAETTATVSGMISIPETQTPVTGKLGSAEVKGQNITLHIDNLKLTEIQAMPELTLDYSGAQIAKQ